MTLFFLAALLAADSANASSVVLRWKPVDGAVFYDLEVATDPDFKDVVLALRLNTNGYRWEALPDRVHYFRARGLDEKEQAGPWSEPKEIAAVFVPPALTRPKKGQVFVTGGEPERVEFHFELLPLYASYHLEIAEDERFTTRIFDETSPASPIIFTAKALGFYRYRFSARTADGKETKPSEGAFQVIIAAPEPLLADGVVVVSGSEVPLAWTKVKGASGYRVQVSSSSGQFKPDLLNERSQKTELAFRTTAPGVYSWRVYSEDERGRRYGPSTARAIHVEERRAATSVPAPATRPAPRLLSLRLGLGQGFGYNFMRSGSLLATGRAALGVRLGPGRLLFELNLGFQGFEASRELSTMGTPGVFVIPLDPSVSYELAYGDWRFFAGATLALRPGHLMLTRGTLTAHSPAIAVGVGGGLGFGYAFARTTATFELRFLHALLADPAIVMQVGGMIATMSIWYEIL